MKRDRVDFFSIIRDLIKIDLTYAKEIVIDLIYVNHREGQLDQVDRHSMHFAS